MTTKVELKNTESVEFAFNDLKNADLMFNKMGFDCIGERNQAERKSKLFKQGDVLFIASASSNEKDGVYQFLKKHGDGIFQLYYKTDSVVSVFEAAKKNGAQVLKSPHEVKDYNGKNHQLASVAIFGDVQSTFVHEGSFLTADFFGEQKKSSPDKGKFVQTIDHVTVNLEKGQVDKVADFYKNVFGFYQVRSFDIRTEKTGLFSRALRSNSGRVTMPFNEPTNAQSQIQEFVDTFHGPGVQHIALHTSEIIGCLKHMIQQKFKFLSVPRTYYDAVPTRVKHVSEDLNVLADLGILVDGSDQGYLLQIFTEPVIGPFFFEYIQRKGDQGFGDGNFRALFEAIERDQIKRGVLR